MGVGGQHHAPSALYPRGKSPGTHCTGGWVGPRAGLNSKARRKILFPCRGSNPVRPVRSQTLYWLRYPGSRMSVCSEPKGLLQANYQPSEIEVLTSVKMPMVVFWVVTPCDLVGAFQRFARMYRLHLQGEAATLLHKWEHSHQQAMLLTPWVLFLTP
jgi:hypothetical protein